jgi:hypothetical protein
MDRVSLELYNRVVHSSPLWAVFESFLIGLFTVALFGPFLSHFRVFGGWKMEGKMK